MTLGVYIWTWNYDYNRTQDQKPAPPKHTIRNLDKGYSFFQLAVISQTTKNQKFFLISE